MAVYRVLFRLLLFIFIFVFVSSQKPLENFLCQCADQDCSEPLFEGNAVTTYNAIEDGVVSVKREDKLTVYGICPKHYGVLANGKKGFIPHSTFKEKRKISRGPLKFSVNSKDYLQIDKNNVVQDNNNKKSAELKATSTKEITSENKILAGDPIPSINPSSPVDHRSSHIDNHITVFDGTTITLADDIAPTSTPSYDSSIDTSYGVTEQPQIDSSIEYDGKTVDYSISSTSGMSSLSDEQEMVDAANINPTKSLVSDMQSDGASTGTPDSGEDGKTDEIVTSTEAPSGDGWFGSWFNSEKEKPESEDENNAAMQNDDTDAQKDDIDEMNKQIVDDDSVSKIQDDESDDFGDDDEEDEEDDEEDDAEEENRDVENVLEVDGLDYKVAENDSVVGAITFDKGISQDPQSINVANSTDQVNTKNVDKSSSESNPQSQNILNNVGDVTQSEDRVNRMEEPSPPPPVKPSLSSNETTGKESTKDIKDESLSGSVDLSQRMNVGRKLNQQVTDGLEPQNQKLNVDNGSPYQKKQVEPESNGNSNGKIDNQGALNPVTGVNNDQERLAVDSQNIDPKEENLVKLNDFQASNQQQAAPEKTAENVKSGDGRKDSNNSSKSDQENESAEPAGSVSNSGVPVSNSDHTVSNSTGPVLSSAEMDSNSAESVSNSAVPIPYSDGTVSNSAEPVSNSVEMDLNSTEPLSNPAGQGANSAETFSKPTEPASRLTETASEHTEEASKLVETVSDAESKPAETAPKSAETSLKAIETAENSLISDETPSKIPESVRVNNAVGSQSPINDAGNVNQQFSFQTTEDITPSSTVIGAKSSGAEVIHPSSTIQFQSTSTKVAETINNAENYSTRKPDETISGKKSTEMDGFAKPAGSQIPSESNETKQSVVSSNLLEPTGNVDSSSGPAESTNFKESDVLKSNTPNQDPNDDPKEQLSSTNDTNAQRLPEPTIQPQINLDQQTVPLNAGQEIKRTDNQFPKPIVTEGPPVSNNPQPVVTHADSNIVPNFDNMDDRDKAFAKLAREIHEIPKPAENQEHNYHRFANPSIENKPSVGGNAAEFPDHGPPVYGRQSPDINKSYQDSSSKIDDGYNSEEHSDTASLEDETDENATDGYFSVDAVHSENEGFYNSDNKLNTATENIVYSEDEQPKIEAAALSSHQERAENSDEQQDAPSSPFDNLKDSLQAIIEWIPEPVYSSLMELKAHGLSPRLVFVAIWTGLLATLLTITICYLQRGSKEHFLRGNLCKAEENIFKLGTENKIMKEELEISKKKTFSLEAMVKASQGALIPLQEELRSSKNQSSELHQAVEHMQAQLNAQREMVLSTQSEAKRRSEENYQLQVKVQESEMLIVKYEDEQGKLTERQKTLEAENSEVLQLRDELYIQLQQFQENRNQLLQEAIVWNQRVEELKVQIEDYQNSQCELESNLKSKEDEIQVLNDAIQQIKAIKLTAGEDGNNEEFEEMLKEVVDASKVRLELQRIEGDFDDIKHQLASEKERGWLLESQYAEAESKMNLMKEKYTIALQDKTEAQTKLEVLTNYFKEKETQLQKELGAQEAMRQQKEVDASSSARQLSTIHQECKSYKSQIASLKQEVEETERSYKNQLAVQEKKAHESWLAARAAERKLEDQKQEGAVLRQRLTLLEREAKNTAESNRQRLNARNGELPGDMDPSADLTDPSVSTNEELDPSKSRLRLPVDRPLPPPPSPFGLPPFGPPLPGLGPMPPGLGPMPPGLGPMPPPHMMPPPPMHMMPPPPFVEPWRYQPAPMMDFDRRRQSPSSSSRGRSSPSRDDLRRERYSPQSSHRESSRGSISPPHPPLPHFHSMPPQLPHRGFGPPMPPPHLMDRSMARRDSYNHLYNDSPPDMRRGNGAISSSSPTKRSRTPEDRKNSTTV